MKIDVYSDGSATTNDKPGGFGWVMVVDGAKVSEGSGHMSNASNNDAELEAAIQGLIAVYKYVFSVNRIPLEADVFPAGYDVTLVSDSQIILNWANGKYRFKQEDKINKYKLLMKLVKKMDVKTRWVRGHSGDPHNERCDKLANYARVGAEPEQAMDPAEDTLIGTRKDGIIAIWHKDKLKIVDLANNVCEDYNRKTHGLRSSTLEVRTKESE